MSDIFFHPHDTGYQYLFLIHFMKMAKLYYCDAVDKKVGGGAVKEINVLITAQGKNFSMVREGRGSQRPQSRDLKNAMSRELKNAQSRDLKNTMSRELKNAQSRELRKIGTLKMPMLQRFFL